MKFLSGADHPKAVYPKVEKAVIRLVVKHPEWGCRSISHKISDSGQSLSYVQVNKLLNRLGAENYDRRVNFSRNYAGPGRLKEDVRKEIVNKSLEGESISKLSRDYHVSRDTIYRWVNKHKNGDSLSDCYPVSNSHPGAVYPKLENKVLSVVARDPSLSVHSIAKQLPISTWTIWSILNRHNLNTHAQRKAYAANKFVDSRPEASQSFGRVRSVFESFTPSLTPAPPPIKTIISFLILIFVSFFFAASYWLSNIISLGHFFASLALFAGMFFFLYSLKYYITIAIVLSYSQKDDADNQDKKKKGSFIEWLLGKKKLLDRESNITGLKLNLDDIALKDHPFVSVHIALYNEKKVVERLLRAAYSFDYDNYEIILADDSTDATSDAIRQFQKKFLLKEEELKITMGEGCELSEVEIKPGIFLKHLHRSSRSGFKGGALKLALEITNPQTEYVSVFDADFVPYPDTLTQFVKYFQASSKSERTGSAIAAVQGYQWHILNKSENWITRGVRSEYAGSYIIERSGTEIYGGLKQISGSVYMIKKDILQKIGWGESITEDFELTLKLYSQGYKVIYTPYIQAPAECVSSIKSLIRQRMRWAEGHSNNIKKNFIGLMAGNSLSLTEKFEFLYLAPYYLQALFFFVGTISWLVSEAIFRTKLPFWTELWGWSLVMTNIIALPLLNGVGLFLEESENKDYSGLFSFILLSYILAPFQAYAAVKGFLEKEEGNWFRTPKTGKITDVFTRGRLFRLIERILPGQPKPAIIPAVIKDQPPAVGPNTFLATANNQFDSFSIKKGSRWLGMFFIVFLLIVSASVFSRVPSIEFFPRENKPATAFRAVTKPDLNSTTDEIMRPKEEILPRKDFRFDQNPELFFVFPEDNHKKASSNFWWKIISNVKAEEEYRASLFDSEGNAETVALEVLRDGAGQVMVRIPAKSSLTPGVYTLKVESNREDGGIIQIQDFSWGVLAINTNRGVYLPGETAFIQMATLREDGHTLCDAALELKIKDKNTQKTDIFSTEDGTITKSPDCWPDNITKIPDYYLDYTVGEAGDYEIELTNLDNGYKIFSSYLVKNSVDFEIERIGLTRIYPAATYPMKIRVKFNSDFSGRIQEKVPLDFSISGPADLTVEDRGEEKILSWSGDWRAGETVGFEYQFDAPDISPEFYLLGPLKIGNYEENRSWQIASDAPDDTGLHSPSADGEDYTNWTNPTYAYSSNDSRAVPASATSSHDYYNFSLGVPSGSKIVGIEVSAEFCRTTGAGPNGIINLEMSWDGGASYTTSSNNVSTTQACATGDVSQTAGSSSNTWGRTWDDTDFSDANFRLRVQNGSGGYLPNLDHVQVRVYYTYELNQAAYRFFANSDSTDVGSALANQDTAATAPDQGTPFRLRLGIDVTGANLAASGLSLKLQFAQKSGTCDTAFSGETYGDVSPSAGVIRYYGNTTPADGDTATANANDPTYSGHTKVMERYEEQNNSDNVNAVNVSQYGLWDFSLVDNSATGGTSYCFRVVNSADESVLNIYTVIPEITTATTSPPPTNDSLTFTNPSSDNKAIADNSTEWNFRAVVSDLDGYADLATVELRMADSSDNTTPYADLEFTWTQATNAFSETGSDALSAAAVSANSSSSCASNSCTIDFKIKFTDDFAHKNTNYNIELYSIDDSANADENSYSEVYEIVHSKLVDTSTSASSVANSFQRKTWFDGTRIWSALYSGTQIEFWYSGDWGSTWTQNSGATIAVNTNDFTVEADSTNAFIAYTNGYDIEVRSASSYPGTSFTWGSATAVYNGSSSIDEYDYPAITRDSNNKIWITARHYGSASPYLYLYANGSYQYFSDFLGGVNSVESESTDTIDITGRFEVVDNKIRIKISEELEERVFIDRIFLRVNGGQKIIEADSTPKGQKDMLSASDNKYLVMEQKDAYYLEFPVPSDYEKLEFVAEGYYLADTVLETVSQDKSGYQSENLINQGKTVLDQPPPLDLHENIAGGVDAYNEVYRWQATTGGSRYSFGLKGEGGTIPSVKITNQDGFFIKYQPSAGEYVQPNTEKNIIQWNLGDGIGAKYTIWADRVKADYWVENEEALAGRKLEFKLEFNPQIKTDQNRDGTISWTDGEGKEIFKFPLPEIVDAAGQKTIGTYIFRKISEATATLIISIPADFLQKALYPIVIDPTVLNSSIRQYYGNSPPDARHIIQTVDDILVACYVDVNDDPSCRASADAGATWGTEARITGSADELAVAEDHVDGDVFHLVHNETTGVQLKAGNLRYYKATISGTTISFSSGVTIDESDYVHNMTIIVDESTNRPVVAWDFGSEDQSPNRSGIRFLRCDAGATDCDSAITNWCNAAGTSCGTAPSAHDVDGSADVMGVVAAFDIIGVGLAQMPGTSTFTDPTSVKWDDNGAFTTLTNAYDNNTGTTSSINSLSSTQDYLYVGYSSSSFGKVHFDITNTNANAATLTAEYYNGSWTAIGAEHDGTESPSGTSFGQDGAVGFVVSDTGTGIPSDWTSTSIDSVSAYWIRFRPSADFDSTVSIAETDIAVSYADDLYLIYNQETTDYVYVNVAGWDGTDDWNWLGPMTEDTSTTTTAHGAQAVSTNQDLTNNKVFYAFLDENGASDNFQTYDRNTSNTRTDRGVPFTAAQLLQVSFSEENGTLYGIGAVSGGSIAINKNSSGTTWDGTLIVDVLGQRNQMKRHGTGDKLDITFVGSGDIPYPLEYITFHLKETRAATSLSSLSSNDDIALTGQDDYFFDEEDYSGTDTSDDTYDSGVTADDGNDYITFYFKDTNTDNTDTISPEWQGQFNQACSETYPAKLQVYNRNSAAWADVASSTSCSADTDFSLSGTISTNLSYYYGTDDWIGTNTVAFRVYKQSNTTAVTGKTDYFTQNVPLFGGGYYFKAVRSSSANDISGWGTASNLDDATQNANKFGVATPLNLGDMYAVWIDGTAIEGCFYDEQTSDQWENSGGTACSSSVDSIDTGVSGTNKNMSAVADTTNYDVHLVYVEDDTTDTVSYARWDNGTGVNGGWQTEITLDSSDNNAYVSMSINTASADKDDLYAFWIDSTNNNIYYRKCDDSAAGSECSSADDWASEVAWQSEGVNTYVTSNYSGDGMIFTQWNEGSISPYSVAHDNVIIAENLWLALFLAPLGNKFYKYLKKKKRK